MLSTSSVTEPKQDTSDAHSNRARRTFALALLIVWAISVGYMATHLNRGWVPHDEGTLGRSAERVLNGELPHRDFDDYTGGLTFVHALAFRAFGIDSGSMRIILFAFFVLWIPAVFYVASRFGAVYSAGAVTLLAVAWSVPNYPGPMPSWYNLFFATFGVAALLRYLEVGTRRWLFIAGLCGGLSILAKITAAYFVAGTLLFFIFREQSTTNDKNRELTGRGRLYSAAVALALTVFLVLLFNLIHRVPGIRGPIYFVLPAFGLVALLVAREFNGIAGKDRERFMALMRMCVPFVAGIVVPLLLFLIPYALAGSVHDLVQGLTATPTRAIRFALFEPEHPATMVTMAPFLVPVIIAYECGRLGRAICTSIFMLCAGAVLIFSTRSPVIYGLGWHSLSTAIPALVLAGVAILCDSRYKQKLSPMRRQQIMLLMCVTALCSLVQFPFAAPVYFLYVAPLAILLATALFASATHPPRFVLGALIGFYLLFAVMRFTPGFLHYMGFQYSPDTQTERLTIVRAGGLRVQSSEAQLYEELIPLVQSHAAGKFIYAAPDCPEVYFLSGLQNPTRHYFDYAEEPLGHTARVLRELESLNVNVVAINKEPLFSYPMSPELKAGLEQRYGQATEVGTFQVRWKE